MGRTFEKSLTWRKRAKAALVGGGQPLKLIWYYTQLTRFVV